MYIDGIELGFGFQAFFPNVIAISFDISFSVLLISAIPSYPIRHYLPGDSSEEKNSFQPSLVLSLMSSILIRIKAQV
jgi:ABC-type spermidine/putrescine transport system permease subunit I